MLRPGLSVLDCVLEGFNATGMQFARDLKSRSDSETATLQQNWAHWFICYRESEQLSDVSDLWIRLCVESKRVESDCESEHHAHAHEKSVSNRQCAPTRVAG